MDKRPRLVSAQRLESDEEEKSLRPVTFDEFVGQSKIVENLKVFIQSAKMRSQPLDHVLLAGPPGLGKTTLAYIIARDLGVNIRSASAPLLDKSDVASILTSLEGSDILFIDEIHRLSPAIEEILYPAMEDRTLDIIIGQGMGAKAIKINLSSFTMIGATTRTGLLTSALRDRFGIPVRLNYYGRDDLKKIAIRTSSILNCPITDDAAFEIADRSRRTPRIVNRLIKRVSDFATVMNRQTIDLEITRYALKQLDIDDLGLDEMDRKILSSIIEKYDGGPVGIKTIAISVGEEIETLEDFYEPFLVQIGLLQRTPRGRVATRFAFEHLGIEYRKAFNNSLQKSLFTDNSD